MEEEEKYYYSMNDRIGVASDPTVRQTLLTKQHVVFLAVLATTWKAVLDFSSYCYSFLSG